MATNVIMPKQGLQMTEGTITKWLAREGQAVVQDEPLFEMETDKLTIEIPSPVSGTLLKIIRGEGETVPITETIAVIGEPGEKTDETAGAKAEDAPAAAAATSKEAGRTFATPRAKTRAAEKNIDVSALSGTGPDGLVIEKDVLGAAAAGQAAVKATPLAARIASQKDVKLDEVAGTGARGKIVRADVEAAASARVPAQPAAPGKVIPFAGIRKVIADRMMQSLQGSAQASHRIKVDMSEIVRLREKLKDSGIKVSFTDILVKVTARALRDFPMVNASLVPEGILLQDMVNIGLAVALENGLIVPVIKNADKLGLEDIASVSAVLADKAKTGKLLPDDYAGGTFTITNLGMYDIDEFIAIINPPESAILAVGKIERTPVADGDNVVIRPIMKLSLTYDHRIIDGAPAAQFLQRIKQLLQNPFLMM